MVVGRRTMRMRRLERQGRVMRGRQRVADCTGKEREMQRGREREMRREEGETETAKHLRGKRAGYW